MPQVENVIPRQKGSPAMQAHFSEQPRMIHHADAQQSEVGHFLYQGATVAAILLFLISFWSC